MVIMQAGKAEVAHANLPEVSQIATDLFKIIKLIMDRDLDPCIVFSFSKKDCETYAMHEQIRFQFRGRKHLSRWCMTMLSLSEEDRATK